jgi:hypothetical protein
VILAQFVRSIEELIRIKRADSSRVRDPRSRTGARVASTLSRNFLAGQWSTPEFDKRTGIYSIYCGSAGLAMSASLEGRQALDKVLRLGNVTPAGGPEYN